MKKRLLTIICALVLMFNFTACGGGDKYADSPYVGTWKATSAESMGMELSVASVIGGEMIIVLEADGTCSIDAAGDEGAGTWEETETGANIDDGDVILTIEGDSAYLEQDDVKINFERQASE